MKKILTTIVTFVYILAFLLLVSSKAISYHFTTIEHTSPLNENFSVFALTAKPEVKKKIIYGFLPYWKLNKAKYIQLDKMTDIAYFSLRINADGTIKKLNDDGTTEPGYNNWTNNQELNKLIVASKKQNVNFALTIISHEDDISDAFLDCRSCWNTLAKEVERELESKKIKDVNLDFEYVGHPEVEKSKQYTQFVSFLNKELDSKFGNSTVTVSTFADSSIKSRITNPEELAKVVDQLFVMAYDFHYPNSERAGPVAPINKVEGFTSYDINTMLKDYLKTIPPNKIILGVPYYGYNWVVENQNPYAARIEGNDYSGYSISQTYEDIVNVILETKPTIMWDETAKVPYFSYISDINGSNRMVYFENPESLKEKYKVVKDFNLGGVGIWALGYDGGYQELWKLLEKEFILN